MFTLECVHSTSISEGRLSVTSQNMESASVDSLLKGYDEIQAKLMDEECILINEDDVKVGAAAKKVCHLWTNIEKGRHCFSLWNGLLYSLSQ